MVGPFLLNGIFFSAVCAPSQLVQTRVMSLPSNINDTLNQNLPAVFRGDLKEMPKRKSERLTDDEVAPMTPPRIVRRPTDESGVPIVPQAPKRMKRSEIDAPARMQGRMVEFEHEEDLSQGSAGNLEGGAATGTAMPRNINHAWFKDEVYTFLFRLRTSGITNMFESVFHVMDTFQGINHTMAKELVLFWMRHFHELESRLIKHKI